MIPGLNPLFQKLKIWKKEKYEAKSLLGGIVSAVKQGFGGRNDDYFEVMFNPESYSLSYVNQYSRPQGINTTGKRQKYQLSKPHELSLTLTLDGTGATDYLIFSAGSNVSKRVQEFLKMTTTMDGDQHKPNDLVLAWGNLVFECVLSKVDIKYTLFDRTGLALRAELNTTFIGSIEDAKRVKQEDKKSPDLTRERIVQAGDTLPLIASELYENPSYYLELARVNGLNHFRKLKPGSTLRLPPLGRQDQ